MINYQRSFNRSPDPGDGNGGNPPANPAEGGGDGGAPAAPAWKADFDSLRSEISQHLQRLTPQERREERRESAEDKTPQKPSLKDFDFDKDPDAAFKYQQASFEYLQYQRDQKSQRESAEKESKATEAKNYQGHQARVFEYKKEHPEFDADYKAANIRPNDDVVKVIVSSKKSHLVAHYLAKHPGADEELNLLSQTDGAEAVRERIGEMAAEMKFLDTKKTQTREQAAHRPIRMSLAGGAQSSSKKDLTIAERIARHNER